MYFNCYHVVNRTLDVLTVIVSFILSRSVGIKQLIGMYCTALDVDVRVCVLAWRLWFRNIYIYMAINAQSGNK